MNILSAIRKEILEQWRTHRLLVAVAVLVLFGLLSPLTAKFMPDILKSVSGGEQFAALIPPPTVKDAVDQYIKNISQFTLIICILMSMGSVAQEKESGTAAMMLVKPMSRAVFIFAKLAGLVVVFGTSLLLAGLGAYFYTLLLFEALPALPWVALNSLLLLHTMVFVALTLFFSTISRSQALAGGLCLAVIAALSLVGSIPSVREFVPANLVNWATALMRQTGQTAWPALWICFAIILVSLLGSWLVLRHQEL
jgi:ABC-2 type transport system permease protein